MGNFVAKLSDVASSVKVAAKKNSPEILMVAGVVSTVAGVVLACRATLKAQDILDEHEEMKDAIKKVEEKYGEDYTEEDKKKDTVTVYAKTAVRLVADYAPAVATVTLGIVCMMASNNILKKRNVALASAYAGLDNLFNTYRKRVVDKYGDEVDQQLRYGVHKEKIEEEETDEDGKVKKVKKEVDVVDGDESGYARYFTKANPNWEQNSDYNEMFIRNVQNYCNAYLRANKVLTLNQVYDQLGMPTTKAGMVVGWIYDKTAPTGDNYVDISVKPVKIKNENNALEQAYLLDFNVDGNIYNELKY